MGTASSAAASPERPVRGLNVILPTMTRTLDGGPLDACTNYTAVFTRRTMSDLHNGPRFGLLLEHASNVPPSSTGSSAATILTQYVGSGVPCGSCGSSAWEGACAPHDRADDGCWGATQRRCNIDWVNAPCMCPRLPDGTGWRAATVGGTARENCGRSNSTCSWPSDLLRNLLGVVDLLAHAGAAKLPPAFTAGFIRNFAERVRAAGGADADLSDMAHLEKLLREAVELARGSGDAGIAAAVRSVVVAYLEPHCFTLRRLLPEERRATDKDNVPVVYGSNFLTSPACRFMKTTLDQPADASLVADPIALKQMFDDYCAADVAARSPAAEVRRLRERAEAIRAAAGDGGALADWAAQTLEFRAAQAEAAAGAAALQEHPVDADVRPATTAECDCIRAGTQISAAALAKVGVQDTSKPLPNFYRASRSSPEEAQIQADRLSREVIRRTYGLVSTPADRHCWFRPCDGTNAEFVSDIYRNSLTCPSTICQANIVVDRTGGNVSIANNNFNISCTGSRDVPCPEGTRPTERGCEGSGVGGGGGGDDEPGGSGSGAGVEGRRAESGEGEQSADEGAGETLAARMRTLFEENRAVVVASAAGLVLVLAAVAVYLVLRARRRSAGAAGTLKGPPIPVPALSRAQMAAAATAPRGSSSG
jgi:hypothetical protein